MFIVGTPHKLVVGDILNQKTREVFRQKQPIVVNKIQFQLLCLLVKYSPDVVSKETIENEIWSDKLPQSDVLKTQIYQLRNAIDKPFSTSLIHNVHGVGFRLAEAQ